MLVDDEVVMMMAYMLPTAACMSVMMVVIGWNSTMIDQQVLRCRTSR